MPTGVTMRHCHLTTCLLMYSCFETIFTADFLHVKSFVKTRVCGSTERQIQHSTSTEKIVGKYIILVISVCFLKQEDYFCSAFQFISNKRFIRIVSAFNITCDTQFQITTPIPASRPNVIIIINFAQPPSILH